jgi:hypothetical protein
MELTGHPASQHATPSRDGQRQEVAG